VKFQTKAQNQLKRQLKDIKTCGWGCKAYDKMCRNKITTFFEVFMYAWMFIRAWFIFMQLSTPALAYQICSLYSRYGSDLFLC